MCSPKPMSIVSFYHPELSSIVDKQSIQDGDITQYRPAVRAGGGDPVTSGFPTQRAMDSEIWCCIWCHERQLLIKNSRGRWLEMAWRSIVTKMSAICQRRAMLLQLCTDMTDMIPRFHLVPNINNSEHIYYCYTVINHQTKFWTCSNLEFAFWFL